MRFRLCSEAHDFWVEASLRSFGERWLAVAYLGGDPEIGLGSTARDALADALSSLGPKAAEVFLADPQLSPSVSGELSRDA